MDDTLAILLLMAMAMLAAVVVVLGTSRIRAGSRNAALTRRAEDEAGQVAALTQENEGMRAKIERQEARLQVLERIATDPARRTADEIELLR